MGRFMMSQSREVSNLEDSTYRMLGEFFVAFARVELNLSLRVGPAGTFGDKLDRFFEVAHYIQVDNQFFKMVAWYMAADSLREIRNRFAHGRWGFDDYTQTVVHVSGYPPNIQNELHFSLAELDMILQDTKLVGSEICDLPRECPAGNPLTVTSGMR